MDPILPTISLSDFQLGVELGDTKPSVVVLKTNQSSFFWHLTIRKRGEKRLNSQSGLCEVYYCVQKISTELLNDSKLINNHNMRCIIQT